MKLRTGTHMHAERFGMSVRPALVTRIDVPDYSWREPKPERKFNGPKPAGTGKVLYPDEQVLEVRRLHEWQGLRPREIAERTGIAAAYVEALIKYRVRAHLDPGPKPATEQATA